MTPDTQAEIENEADAQVSIDPANILGYRFNDDSTLMWPVNGELLMGYNMDNTVYYQTLDLYKCNPAIVIKSEVGENVVASCDGIVTAVYDNEETGTTLVVAIGNDYAITYGQLENLCVGVGTQVKRGDILATVASPSRYYSLEGPNLFYRLDSAEGPVDPMEYLFVNE